MKFSDSLQSPLFQTALNRSIQDPERIRRFMSAIISAVATNSELEQCEHKTILSAALLGETLNLSPSPQLGQYYMVPFNGKAVFIPGYKGYYELALRSGQYRRLNAVEVKMGELISYDPFEEVAVFQPIQDPVKREVAETIGYYAYYELTNGFRRTLYWSKEKMYAHGKRYSKAFNKADSFWQKDFDVMAKKTMYRQLLALAPKSIEMQDMYAADTQVIGENLMPLGNPAEPNPYTEPYTVTPVHDGDIVDSEPVKEKPPDTSPPKQPGRQAVPANNMSLSDI